MNGKGGYHMKREIITDFLKGIWVGGTMTVPGVSGGSMAMLLGIYDRLIRAVNSFWKNKGELLFLTVFAVGGGLGMVLFSGSLLHLMERYPMPLKYFFLGAVAGGIPVIYREAEIKKFSLDVILYPVIGILIVMLLSFLPSGMFSPGEGGGVTYIFIQLAGGILTAAALVLPGISVSQMLLMLGKYEGVMENISSLKIIPLLPLGIGTVLGILLTAKLMEHLMKKYPHGTYLIIFGFLLGSIPELFPGVPRGWELVISLVMALAGFFALYGMQKKQPEHL